MSVREVKKEVKMTHNKKIREKVDGEEKEKICSRGQSGDKPTPRRVIVPEARESPRSAAGLMARHSLAYFTGHIYICRRSDLAGAHLSLICSPRPGGPE